MINKVSSSSKWRPIVQSINHIANIFRKRHLNSIKYYNELVRKNPSIKYSFEKKIDKNNIFSHVDFIRFKKKSNKFLNLFDIFKPLKLHNK